MDLRADDQLAIEFPELALVHVLNRALGRKYALIEHVACCAVGTHERLLVVDRPYAVLELGTHKAVGLAIHRLRTERRRHKEDLATADLAFQRSLGLRAPLNNLHLDAGVLLRAKSLTLRAVVVHAGLSVFWAVDRVALSELDLAELVELVRLPSHKAVVIRVRVGGDERPSPVDS